MTLKIELKNEQIKSFICTQEELKMIKLTKLREKLQIPHKFQNQFYFKAGPNAIENEA